MSHANLARLALALVALLLGGCKVSPIQYSVQKEQPGNVAAIQGVGTLQVREIVFALEPDPAWGVDAVKWTDHCANWQTYYKRELQHRFDVKQLGKKLQWHTVDDELSEGVVCNLAVTSYVKERQRWSTADVTFEDAGTHEVLYSGSFGAPGAAAKGSGGALTFQRGLEWGIHHYIVAITEVVTRGTARPPAAQ